MDCKQKEISLKNITQEEEIMNHYDVAKLTDTEVKQLNEYQTKVSLLFLNRESLVGGD